LKVEVDPEGGINYVMNQTSQLLSVPYALYAGNSGSNLNLLGQDYINLTGQTLTINKVDLANDVDGVLPVVNGGTGSSTAPMVGVITAVDATDARLILGLGSAATTDSSDYATAAQGVLADSALQDATVFATAAQGATADAALPAANVSTFGATLIDDADASAARTTLGLGTAATTNALTYGIADTNALKVDQTGDAADNDFAKFTANGIEGRDASEMRKDLDLVIGTNVLAEKAIGIADDNLLEVDQTTSAASGDFAKFTANGIEGRDASEMRTDLGVDALGTFALQSGDITGNIMTKIVQITTSSSESSNATRAHGLTLSKIVGFQAMLNNSDGVLVNENSEKDGAGSTFGPNYFGVTIGATNITVTTSTTSSGNKTLNRTCTVLIIYLE
jgi:hypothetical protein